MNEIMKELLQQEEELVFTSFTNEDSLKLGLIIIDIAKEKFGRGIALNIIKNDVPLFTHFMEGTSAENIYWVTAKKNVVMHYGHSSLYVDKMYRDMGTTFRESGNLSLDTYQAEGGSFPLIIKGTGVQGTITVSGLTSQEDHDLAVAGIRKFLGK